MRFFEPLSIVLSLIVAYVWVTIPELRGFSLQLTALTLVLLFVAKRLSRARLHHLLPKPETFETALLVGAVALGVGSTGGLDSPFLPLFHLTLFVGVLTLRLSTNIAKLIGITVFLWAVSPHPLSNTMWIELLSLPFLLPLMIFARVQFDEAREQRYRADQEKTLLRQEEEEVIHFLSEFLHPKLQQLERAVQTTPDNRWMVERQISMLEKESREFLIGIHEKYLLHQDSPKDTPTEL